MSTTIRPATTDDVATLIQLVSQYWRFDAIEGFDASKIQALLKRVIAEPTLGQAWLATVEDRPAGYLLAVFVFSLEYQGLTAEIDELFVSPDHRGQGLGGRLLDTAEESFRARGCTKVFLQVGRDNDEARAFYRSRGFRGRNGFDLVDKSL
jgi:ribosomal protein S18 acetylase RimI-like enzyme